MTHHRDSRRRSKAGRHLHVLLPSLLALLIPMGAAAAAGSAADPPASASCADLLDLPDVTVLRASDRTTAAGTAYCHARGVGPRAIAWHVALPDAWNGRLVYLGDGGQDGDLDDAPFLIDAGYAFVNSNMGHDDGVEGQAFGLDDPDSEFDFAWRAQHHALTAAKRIVTAHYGRPQHHAYHFGCSTGGRQGLLAAQILPDDYDGIVAGAPGHLWYERMAHRVAVLQTLYGDGMAANLAYDTDGDGVPEDLGKVALLVGRVQNQCDAADGIRDGLVEPAFCNFEPRTSLADLRCPEGTDGPACFTPAQLEAVVQLYEGSRDSSGRIVYPGAPVGSETQWPAVFLPHEGNALRPYALISATQVIGYRFYADDPGRMPPDLENVERVLDRDSALPEWGWWTFDLDDLNDPDLQGPTYELMRGDDADLTPFLKDRGGKLLMFHGWADAVIPPGPTIDYFEAVTKETFDGDARQAAEHMRLYGVPGMGHCRGGNGPQPAYLTWLETLVAWVEDGQAPETITAQAVRDGSVVNERPLCPWPARTLYTGPAGTQDDPDNWRSDNFECR